MGDAFDRDGFAIRSDVVGMDAVEELLKALSHSLIIRSRAGMRHALAHSAVRAVAESAAMLSLAQALIGSGAFAFRATLFDKSPQSNWHVVWHQDTALPFVERHDVAGFGPWSQKAGISYAHAPAAALEPIVALRLHLDDSSESNGPLRVLPGTHALGVLADSQVDELVASRQPVACVAPRGSVVAMRPLILHASSKATSKEPRRVLHIEYAPQDFQPHPVLRLATA
jgi:ectoine hydroxylase-related dioxygenase (phytanoyl-CoA dioxygenase family)